jgi:8-oxo-dGTP diphosphatase
MAKAGHFEYPYPRPALTVDAVVWTLFNTQLHVLLIQRKHDPFVGKWALPGGFVDAGETLEHATKRELLEETGVEVRKLWPVGTYGDPGRDPRGWTVSGVSYAVLPFRQAAAKAGDDAADTKWFPMNKLPACAFDHAQILRDARWRLRTDAQVLPVLKPLLRPVFSKEELFTLYLLLDATTEKRQLLARLVSQGVVESHPDQPKQYRFRKPRS